MESTIHAHINSPIIINVTIFLVITVINDYEVKMERNEINPNKMHAVEGVLRRALGCVEELSTRTNSSRQAK